MKHPNEISTKPTIADRALLYTKNDRIDLTGMPYDPNIPRLDKRAMVICIVLLTLLIVGAWLVHSYVIPNYSHPTQPFAPPTPK